MRLCDTVRGPLGADSTYEPVVFFAYFFAGASADKTFFDEALAERFAPLVSFDPTAFDTALFRFADIGLSWNPT